MFLIVVSAVFAAKFDDASEGDFNNGTYANTYYNATDSHVRLNSSYTYGNFTSRSFDSNQTSGWKNLSWTQTINPTLITVDVAGDVYKSADLGKTWLLKNKTYGGADAVEVVSLKNGTLIIVDINEGIWESADFGYSWKKVKADYNDAESEDALVMLADISDSLYIFETDEDVWKSNDSGRAWAKINDDFDDSSLTDDAKGAAVNRTGEIFVVTENASVYASADLAVSFVKINNDYNGADSNNATAMISDSKSLYIVHEQSVWNSTNSGVNWTKVNSDFNKNADSDNAVAAGSDSNDNLYIGDQSEDIYISSDLGISWKRQAVNLNGASGDLISLASYRISGLKFQARTDDDNSSWRDFLGPDRTASTYYTNSTLSALNTTDNRYLQYIAYFETPDSDFTQTLSKVTVNYEKADLPPYWSENVTNIKKTYDSDIESWVKIKWQDDSSLDKVLIESNYTGTSVNYTAVAVGNSYQHEAIMPAGYHYWRSHANDSSGNWNSSETSYFNISKASKIVNLLIEGKSINKEIIVNENANLTGELLHPSDGEVFIYEDGKEIARGIPPVSIIKLYNVTGIYNITTYYNGSQNFTADSEEKTLTVKSPEVVSSGRPNRGTPERKLGEELASQRAPQTPAPSPPSSVPANPVASEEYTLPSFEGASGTGPTGAVTGRVVEEGKSFFGEKAKKLRQAIGLIVLLGAMFTSLVIRYRKIYAGSIAK